MVPYLGTIAPGDLAWEMTHLPLYTIWRTGTPGEKAFAVVHCTGRDLLIALACWALALVLAGEPAWPVRTHRRVAALTIVFGVAYTVFSEWLNVVVRGTWAYSDLMPVVPVIDTRLSPLLQWVAVPWLAHPATVAFQRSAGAKWSAAASAGWKARSGSARVSGQGALRGGTNQFGAPSSTTSK